MSLQRTIKAILRKGETHYIAECIEIAVVTQGKTLDETVANLQEAVALHLEGEDLRDLGLAPDPTLILTPVSCKTLFLGEFDGGCGDDSKIINPS